MGLVRSRMVMALGVMALVVVSCGGGGGEEEVSSPSTASNGSGDTGTTASDQEGAEDVPTAGEDDPGERMAVITIDGESTTYDLDDITFSSIEGVDDMTFETCSPDFFGSGRFYAIGYAVDANGEILVGEDGQPSGSFTMDLPPDDWEATERDAPGFELVLNDLDIEMATPEEAAGGTMSWTIDETTASGTAVFVDFENSYTVEFKVICEGSPTVAVDDLPSDGDGSSDGGDGDGGFPLAGAVSGSFTADGESFDDVDVYACEPFSFGSDPDTRDLSLFGYVGGTSGLNVDISHSQGFDLTDGSQFDQMSLNVFYSRQGESGLEQFEAGARNRADGSWYAQDEETFEEIDLEGTPVEVTADRVTGGLSGLIQTWPDEGAATVDVTFDFGIPTEINEEC